MRQVRIISNRGGYFFQWQGWLAAPVHTAARCHVYDGVDFALVGGLLWEHVQVLYRRAEYDEQEFPMSELRLLARAMFGAEVRRLEAELDAVYAECVGAAQAALSGGTVAAAKAAANIARAKAAPPSFVQQAVRHAVTLASYAPDAA